MAADIPYFALNNGAKMPSVGMGCWTNLSSNERVHNMCKTALKVGYRHFDTADMYGNEEAVGQAVSESGIPRSEIFITTKLNNSKHHKVAEAFEDSLKALDCEYVDQYLMHWPQASKGDAIDGGLWDAEQEPSFVETWQAMEKLLDTGKVRSIGVSNFSIKTLEELLPHAKVVPAANQVEIHPCLPQEELKAYCEKKGILLVAYSPLGQTNTLFFNHLQPIAEKYEATPAQIALSWGVQRGTPVIPKSENEGRMTKNISLVKLSDEDMAAINAIHKQPGMHRSLCDYHSPGGAVFGWSYEKLGWHNVKEGGLIS